MSSHKRIGLLFVVIVMLVAWSIAETIWVGEKLQNDADTMARFEKTAGSAKPMTDALERYRRDHDSYPTDLLALNGHYLHSQSIWSEFLYSADPQNFIYKSAECEAGQAQFHGWIVKTADELARAKTQFVAQCVASYRQIALQSPNLPLDPQGVLPDVDRWAYFTSQSAGWAMGWRHYNSNMNMEGVSHGQLVEHNGRCRRP